MPHLPANMGDAYREETGWCQPTMSRRHAAKGMGKAMTSGVYRCFAALTFPEAYRRQFYHDPTVSRETLEEWFSSARLSRYRIEPVDAWYVWNTRISKASLEDISHVEVLLRNFIDVRLNADAGIRCWWDSLTFATEACPTTRAVAEPTSRVTWSSSVTSVTAPPTKNPSSTRILTNKRRFAGLPAT